jgi:hypothetical protein
MAPRWSRPVPMAVAATEKEDRRRVVAAGQKDQAVGLERETNDGDKKTERERDGAVGLFVAPWDGIRRSMGMQCTSPGPEPWWSVGVEEQDGKHYVDACNAPALP